MGRRRSTDSGDSVQTAFKRGDYARVLHASTPQLHAPGAPLSLWQLHGRALEKLNQLSQARAHYRLALQRFGEDAAVLVQLGHVHGRLGERELALNCFARAQALNPELLDSYRGQLAFKPIAVDSEAAAIILRRALDPDAPLRSRARALFLLAQIHAEDGRISSAFEYCRAGNTLLAGEQSSAACEYSIATLRETFHPDLFTALPPPGGAPCPLVIIAGLPRSGKSLVETLLASHPAVHAGGELAVVRQFASTMGRREPLAQLGHRLRSARESSSLARRVARIRSNTPGSPPLICDTSPANLRGLGYLGLAHPDVPVILCQREAQELGLALYFKNFRRGHYYSLRLDSCGRAIARAEALIEHWVAALPNPVMRVSYEDMVRAPTALRGRLLAFLSLEDVQTDSAKPGPKQSDILPWRLFPARSLDGLAAIGDSLLGFSTPYATQLRPLMQAYRAERFRLLPAPGASRH